MWLFFLPDTSKRSSESSIYIVLGSLCLSSGHIKAFLFRLNLDYWLSTEFPTTILDASCVKLIDEFSNIVADRVPNLSFRLYKSYDYPTGVKLEFILPLLS